jgi:hypothetical protein
VMMPYERFEAWQMAHELALEIYRITDRWPKEERFGITIQLRRAALSAPTNIAEGAPSVAIRSSGAFSISRSVHYPRYPICCDSAAIEDCSPLPHGWPSRRCVPARAELRGVSTLPCLALPARLHKARLNPLPPVRRSARPPANHPGGHVILRPPST